MLITFNFPTERFEIFTICRRPPVLQTDARVGMMKIVVRETEARKASGGGLPHPDNSVSKHCAGGCAWQYLRLCWPIRVQNLKAIRALESAYNRYPHLPWALWGKQEIS